MPAHRSVTRRSPSSGISRVVCGGSWGYVVWLMRAANRGGVSQLGPNGRWTTFTTEDGPVDNIVISIAVR